MSDNKKEIVDFSNFVKYLVELGDIYHVDNEWYILKKDNEPAGVVINKKPLPMIIYHEHLKIGDYVILNPFTESLGQNPERNWFFNSRTAILAGLVHRCITQLVTLGLYELNESGENKTPLSYDQLAIVSPYLEIIDAKLLIELSKIRPIDLLIIFYHKQSRTAQLQTRIYEEDYQKSFGAKIRKKSWKFMQNFLETLFKTSAIEEMYIHKSNMIGMQECEATLMVLYKCCKAIEAPVRALLDIDLDIKTFTENIDYLEEYHKMSRWIIGGSQKESRKKEPILDKPPWEDSTLPDSSVPSPVTQQQFVTPAGNSQVPDFTNHNNSINSEVPSFGGYTPNEGIITYAGQSSGVINYAGGMGMPQPTFNQNPMGFGGSNFIMP